MILGWETKEKNIPNTGWGSIEVRLTHFERLIDSAEGVSLDRTYCLYPFIMTLYIEF